mmetsp:Transcript_2501/g.6400  ORF Transcript_2501/g.6400 Transcript_2501/m.6400 type:complete len:174 (+) Transcript_2501:86-607(+)
MLQASVNRPSGMLSTRCPRVCGGFRKPLLKAPVLRKSFLCAASSESSSEAPPASQPKTYSVEFSTRQPAGLVFAQKGGSTGPVYVDEITPGGQADKTGMIQTGDVLIRCSAMLLKDGTEDKLQKEGYGQRLYNNWERVNFDCRGQEFKHVMSALKSNSSRLMVPDLSMTFQRN